MVAPPPRNTPRWSFESRIFWLALAVAAPGLVALGVAISRFESRNTLWLTVFAPLVLLTLILAARLRNRVIFPLYTLSNLLEALREGDFSLRGTRARRGDAIGEVIWEVNTLSQTLREQRLKVQETLALLTKVLGNIDIAILAFDQDARLRLINPAGERLLAVRADAVQGRRAEELDLADCLALSAAATLKRSFPGSTGSFEVRRAEFREGGRPHQLLAITDLSRALREEERKAWQRLIRVLGHELNNSLAPIRSMSSTLRAMLERGTAVEEWREVADRGLAVIGDRAEALTRFMLGYTALARLPAPNKRTVRIDELAARVAALEQRHPVALERGEALTLSADPDQIEQALINLVKNGVEAVLAKGSGGVRVRWYRKLRAACVEVEDDGPGLAATENLFVPFFTTKPGGSGIGLALARQVVEAHGGNLSLSNRNPGPGCIARVTLPLQ
jgi:nitrogen fixation/metabolism regulation signal transduction histidine kinase